MTHPSRSVLRTIAIAGAIVAGLAAAVVAAGVVVLLSRYVQKEDVGPDSAARQFEQVRSRFASQLPLIEFRGFQDPTVRLMNLDTFGDDRDRITLEDIERHGPGLILDVSSGAVGQLLVGDDILGTNARSSRLLVWTEQLLRRNSEYSFRVPMSDLL
jgi:hypothetical protein